MEQKWQKIGIFQNYDYMQGYFVTECAGTPFQKLFLKRMQAEMYSGTFFLGISFMRLGMSCYATALISNKPAYFVQFLKEKLPPPFSDQLLGHYAFWNLFL
jgi:hypothetical protein